MSYNQIQNFLDEEDRISTASAFKKLQFQFVHSSTYERVYGFDDGRSLYTADSRVDNSLVGDISYEQVPPLLRGLTAALTNNLEVKEFLGNRGGWDYFSVRAYVYPHSCGLSWHYDKQCVAAYIYYAHETWQAEWGGELLIANEEPSPFNKGPVSNIFNGRQSTLSRSGVFLSPVPNSLAIIEGGTPHCIKKVEAAAGSNVRASVSGFFFREDM